MHSGSGAVLGPAGQAALSRLGRRFKCLPACSEPLIDMLGSAGTAFALSQRSRLAGQAIRASGRHNAKHPGGCLPPEHALVMLAHKVRGTPAAYLMLCDAGIAKLSLAGIDRCTMQAAEAPAPRKAAQYMPIIRLKPRLGLKAAAAVVAIWSAASYMGYGYSHSHLPSAWRAGDAPAMETGAEKM